MSVKFKQIFMGCFALFTIGVCLGALIYIIDTDIPDLHFYILAPVIIFIVGLLSFLAYKFFTDETMVQNTNSEQTDR